MLKANFSLPNGTIVQVEGTPEDVRLLLEIYGPVGSHKRPASAPVRLNRSEHSEKSASTQHASSKDAEIPDIPAIAAAIKECEFAEAIEKHIIDRSSVVDRTLLPLYAQFCLLESRTGLTSGEIVKVMRELGVPLDLGNVSKALSGAASKYVLASGVRRNGVPTRYSLSRRGIQHIKEVISGTKAHQASNGNIS
jgi:hypothetical protein